VQLIVAAVLSVAFVGGVAATLYYLAQISVIWVKHLVWKRQFRKNPEEATKRLLASLRRDGGEI
jgi:hypothetical protein